MNNQVISAALTDLANAFGNAHPDRRQKYHAWLAQEDWDEHIFQAMITYLIRNEDYRGLPPYSHLVKAYENQAQLMLPGGRHKKPYMVPWPGFTRNWDYHGDGTDWPEDWQAAVAEAWREYETGQKRLL